MSLDTNVFVDLLRGSRGAVRERFAEAKRSGQTLNASLIVAHQLYFGAELHVSRETSRRQVRDILDQVTIEPLDIEDIQAAARVRAGLRRSGLTIGFYDVLIAGQALARGWTVVTNNARAFDRVTDLKLVDWASGPGGPGT